MRGHDAQRHVKGGACVECTAERRADTTNKAIATAYNEAYRKTEKSRVDRARVQAAYQKTPAGKKHLDRYRGSERNKRVQKEFGLRTKYGLTMEQYQNMLTSQDNKCMICRMAFVGIGNTLTAPCVDHCHTTGKVRGLLCGRCNRGLGMFVESIPALQEAINYLTQHRSNK